MCKYTDYNPWSESRAGRAKGEVRWTDPRSFLCIRLSYVRPFALAQSLHLVLNKWRMLLICLTRASLGLDILDSERQDCRRSVEDLQFRLEAGQGYISHIAEFVE